MEDMEISENIYLMSNHKWALYCWEMFKSDNGGIPSRLVHLDYHWDAGCYEGDILKLKAMNLKELKKYIEDNRFITLDDFIAPAFLRGYIAKVDFFCFQDKESLGTFCEFPFDTYKEIDILVSNVGDDEIIFDLDLDVFNKDDMKYDSKGDLWDEKEIINFIEKCKPLIKQAKIITIAKSPEFTGGKEDVDYLTNLIVPMILEIKQKGTQCTQNG